MVEITVLDIKAVNLSGAGSGRTKMEIMYEDGISDEFFTVIVSSEHAMEICLDNGLRRAKMQIMVSFDPNHKVEFAYIGAIGYSVEATAWQAD